MLLSVFSQNNGIQKCITKFKSQNTVYQLGNLVEYITHSDQQQYFKLAKISVIKPFANLLISDYKGLLGITCILEIINLGFRENYPAKELFDNLVIYLQKCIVRFSILEYIFMELEILRECGYGLNLKECGATGVKESLAYVSPKTGRAISYGAGVQYSDKLLMLPQFILDKSEPVNTEDIKSAFKLTGYFISRYIGSVKSREILLDRF